MRVNIVHPGAGQLKYEIRGIVEFAQKLEKTGIEITWENIGDPIAKGEKVPEWIKDIVSEAVKDSQSYAYSPTKGMDAAREYLARTRTADTGITLTPNDILFFNGLGDAITKVYTWLNPVARVIGPTPAYPTHSNVEAAHGRSAYKSYQLDPNNGWLPDVAEVRKKIEEDETIAGILIISPDNPTGMVYPREILEKFVALAKEFDLFLIADEIYANLAYNPDEFVSLAEVACDVPTIVMRGLSKEIPWPGSRCGWLEFYNLHKDAAFESYVKSIEEAKMTEVCSTTLPQVVLPEILADKRYPEHLKTRNAMYEKRAQRAANIFNAIDGVSVVKPKGAFYLSVVCDVDLMNGVDANAPNQEAQQLLDRALNETPIEEIDKRFCYKLLATTGICTVPLTTGFNSKVAGFRMTLLEIDDQKFNATLDSITSTLSN
jgi:aspartate/methionine/tyrosine aminotransferase